MLYGIEPCINHILFLFNHYEYCRYTFGNQNLSIETNLFIFSHLFRFGSKIEEQSGKNARNQQMYSEVLARYYHLTDYRHLGPCPTVCVPHLCLALRTLDGV